MARFLLTTGSRVMMAVWVMAISYSNK
jgi:hypothetical protein